MVCSIWKELIVKDTDLVAEANVENIHVKNKQFESIDRLSMYVFSFTDYEIHRFDTNGLFVDDAKLILHFLIEHLIVVECGNCDRVGIAIEKIISMACTNFIGYRSCVDRI